MQNVADRVHTGFQNYFNGRARFPKQKKYKDYRSFTYPQFGFRLDGEVPGRERGGQRSKEGYTLLALVKSGYSFTGLSKAASNA